MASRIAFLGDTRAEANGNAQRYRQRAYRRLAKLHPEEFTELLNAERAADGLPAVGERTHVWVDHEPCGTRAAYVRHLRNGEPACTECLEANRQHSAGQRQAVA